ncbi:DUF805 domain-containing protein [Janthinobacterium sp. 17J80-10]|uniref:DUF805 domain-containing protein n=1 Tax=Janthinobacterium sp. 17J80-10 TaxID=2497863 RepID=UPI0013E8DC29|nr:DUF805 domain-containing protein [Janthinobacterium sp. 17J80-10]
MNSPALNNPYLAPDAVLTGAPADDDTYEPAIFSLQGRIGRVRYLAYSFLLSLVLMLVAGIITAIVSVIARDPGVTIIVMAIAFYIPSFLLGFAMAKRRLNDLDRTGWLSLLMLVPLVNVVLVLYLIFGAGTPTANRFGPRPVKNSRAVVLSGILIPVFIALIGILAAIAIPAYQSYMLRAQAAQMQQQR